MNALLHVCVGACTCCSYTVLMQVNENVWGRADAMVCVCADICVWWCVHMVSCACVAARMCWCMHVLMHGCTCYCIWCRPYCWMGVLMVPVCATPLCPAHMHCPAGARMLCCRMYALLPYVCDAICMRYVCATYALRMRCRTIRHS